MTKNQRGIVFCYELEAHGETFKAYERFFPESDNQICKTLWRQTALKHIADRRIAGVTASYRNARKIMQNAHHIMARNALLIAKTRKERTLFIIGSFDYGY
ncbi:hypothetical protein [Enterobacter phage N5822]|nr:hypothetical protein [Enterobacter phage N5822]